MPLLTETLGTLTVASGATTSDTLGSQLSAGQLKTALGFLDALSLYCPQGLAEDVTVQLSPVDSPGATDWIDYTTIVLSAIDDLLDENGVALLNESDVPLFAESFGLGNVTAIEDESFKDLRVVLNEPAAATRTFKLLAKLLVH